MEQGARSGAPLDSSTAHRSVELAPQQREALDAVRRWLDDSSAQVFRIFGPAGVGKTTLAREVAAMRSAVRFGAYTGKAVHVLRQKGCRPADTLHSLIYRPAGNDYAEALAEIDEQLAAPDLPQADRERLWLERQRITSAGTALRWERNDGGPLADDDLDLLICDEVSMVNDEMAHDLLSFGVRVLVLGDPEQLPPIRGEGFFTRAAPDVLLTEVHRQADGSPVLDLATRVRTGGGLPAGLARTLTLDQLAGVDQVLCGTNRTRWALTTALRARAGRPFGYPQPGDRIMCLQNNKSLGVFNGQQFAVEGMRFVMRQPVFELDVVDDLGDRRALRVFAAGFQGQDGQDSLKRTGFSGDVAVMTFANAITVHKAQGSEWSSVALAEESGVFTRHDADQGRRWLYTGITRASSELSIFNPSAVR